MSSSCNDRNELYRWSQTRSGGKSHLGFPVRNGLGWCRAENDVTCLDLVWCLADPECPEP